MTEEVSANPTGAESGSLNVNQLAERLRLPSSDATDENSASVEETQSQPEETQVEEPEETTETDEPVAEEQPQGRYKVKVNGEELTVTFDELRKGYQREADYRQKTMKAAEDRKTLEAERTHYAEQLKSFIPALHVQFQDKFANVNWTDLAKSDPAQYVALRAEADQAAMRLNQAISEQKRIEDQTTAERTAARKETLLKEAELTAKVIPGYSDPEKGKIIKAEIKSYLNEIGYSAEEIGGLADHRAARIAYEASQYRKAQKAKTLAAKQGVQQNIPKVQKPGSVTRSDPKAAVVGAARERLGKTGSVRDLAEIFRATE